MLSLHDSKREVLIQVSRIVYKSDYITFYYANPFSQDVLFQITWNRHEAQWFRYILIESNPPYKVRKEWGNTKPEVILPIWQKIRSIALPAHLDCERMGRDGYAFSLEVGDSLSSLAYQWYQFATPDSWDVLDSIAPELMRLCVGLAGKEQELYEINYEKEETDFGTTLFWEIKLS